MSEDKIFQVITAGLDDCRRLIAAGKVQRWDVVKWGVTVNIALAVAAATQALRPDYSLFWLAVAVSFASWLLVWHYNKRMSGARKLATALTDHLKSFRIDYDALMQVERSKPTCLSRFLSSIGRRLCRADDTPAREVPTITYSAREYYDWNYDWQELWIFFGILILAPFLVLLALHYRHMPV
jgi:hypothetical protein